MDPSLSSALLNRAQAYIKLGWYGSALADALYVSENAPSDALFAGAVYTWVVAGRCSLLQRGCGGCNEELHQPLPRYSQYTDEQEAARSLWLTIGKPISQQNSWDVWRIGCPEIRYWQGTTVWLLAWVRWSPSVSPYWIRNEGCLLGSRTIWDFVLSNGGGAHETEIDLSTVHVGLLLLDSRLAVVTDWNNLHRIKGTFF